MAKLVKWSESEIEYLKNNYNIVEFSEILKNINRKENAIRLKAKELGLTNTKPLRWTADEIAMLNEDLTDDEISQRIGRSVTAIRKKRIIINSQVNGEKLVKLFDLSAIEKNIPMVSPLSTSTQHLAMLSALKVNESYEYPNDEMYLVRNQIQLIRDKKFITKKWTNTTRRVWRTK